MAGMDSGSILVSHTRRAPSETLPVKASSPWPALYLLDGNGRLRHTHLGEGAYEQSERNIQRLLKDAGARGFGSDLVSVEAQGAEVAADWASLKSLESYVGYGRPRISRPVEAPRWTSVTCMPHRSGCDSISGSFPVTGR
jgi:hypothetical protein